MGFEARASAHAEKRVAVGEARSNARRRLAGKLTRLLALTSMVLGAATPAAGVDLTTALADTPDPVLASDPVTYTVTWSNQAAATASEAAAQVALPAEATFTSLMLTGSTGPPEACAYSASLHRVECTFFDVDSARVLVLDVDVQPQPGPGPGPSSYNMLAAAVISSVVEVDSDPSNDLDTEFTAVFTCPTAVCLEAQLAPDGIGGYECVLVPDDGATCNGPCFEPGVCIAGVCNLGPPVVCLPSGEPCRENVCNPSIGACELQDLADSTPCSSGAACLTGESCSAGLCQGGTVAPGCVSGVPVGGQGLLPLVLVVLGIGAARMRAKSQVH